MMIPELRAVDRLQTLWDVVQDLQCAPEARVAGDLSTRFKALAHAWVESAAAAHLHGPERRDFGRYRERFESWLAVLAVYVSIGVELKTDPALRERLDRWEAIHVAVAATPARTKNRLTKRQSRPTAQPGGVAEFVRASSRLFDTLRERMLLERETNEVPGANWESALRGGADAIIDELAKLPVPARFVTSLLTGLQALPGCSRLPSPATVRKRLQRRRLSSST
jgi:hypothetical protein